MKIRMYDKEFPMPEHIKAKLNNPKSKVKNPVDVAALIWGNKTKALVKKILQDQKK